MLETAKRLARRTVEPVLDLVYERRRLSESTSAATKAAQRALFLEYRRRFDDGGRPPSVWDTGFRAFSEFDEDGVILFLLASGGLETRRFVDLGAGDGVNASNCANLALNHAFDGLFVDAKPLYVERARRFYGAHPDTRERRPVCLQAFVTRENVDDILRRAGFEGEIDLLSIDIDGNDYWLWEAISCVSPRLVVIEAHTEYGSEDYVMPYDPLFDGRAAPHADRTGASPAAMIRLGKTLGYRLVGANMYGFNLCFVRNDLAKAVPTIPIDELFRHGSYRRRAATADAGQERE
jgi:hypothetical protein